MKGAQSLERIRRGELTPRQREVLGLAAEGLSAQEIAERLCLTKSGVNHHLNMIFEAMRERSGIHERMNRLKAIRLYLGLLGGER